MKTINIIKFVAFALLAVAFVACEKDDDKEPDAGDVTYTIKYTMLNVHEDFPDIVSELLDVADVSVTYVTPTDTVVEKVTAFPWESANIAADKGFMMSIKATYILKDSYPTKDKYNLVVGPCVRFRTSDGTTIGTGDIKILKGTQFAHLDDAINNLNKRKALTLEVGDVD